jgi:hypothetical protein
MQPWLLTLLASVGSIVASSGFWAFIQNRSQSKTLSTKLLLGLAYDKIVTLGMEYINRGHITRDEYEEYMNYLYEPYKACGGNGTAERVVNEVSKLPLRSPELYSEIHRS